MAKVEKIDIVNISISGDEYKTILQVLGEWDLLPSHLRSPARLLEKSLTDGEVHD